MISSKMLFILLVLIYVTLSHEEDPDAETKAFSLENAKSQLKALIDRHLKKILNYGERRKKNIKAWNDSFVEDVAEDFEVLQEFIIMSINEAFTELEDRLYKQLLSLTKDIQGNVEEKFEKFYKDAKCLLCEVQDEWKENWNNAEMSAYAGLEYMY